jgi:hypothetical protein
MPEVPWAVRVTAALLVLLNVDIVLSVLLADGYGRSTALAAAGTLGAVTAEIITRLLPGSGTSQPPALRE